MSSHQTESSNVRRIPAETTRSSRGLFTGLPTNKLLNSIAGAEFARLLPYLEPTSFQSGEYIYELGNEMPYIYFPETLIISQLCYLEDGSSVAVSIIGKDGLLGLSAILDNRHASYWSLATIGGTALRIRTDEFRREFNRAGSVQKIVFNYTHARIVQLAQKSVCNSKHRLEERLCTWLLMIQDRSNSIDLPLTHETISQHLGTRRAGVTNFCNVLRDNGAITYQRAVITILDRQALETTACECYRRLK